MTGGSFLNQYKILIHRETFQKSKLYQKALAAGEAAPGSYLKKNLEGKDVSLLEVPEFLELLVNTKQPQIFAESAVCGDGSDWTRTELSLLGDTGISVPVTVYDNGTHSHPQVHEKPFSATLLYVPGALLRNGCGETPADWDDVTLNGHIDDSSYYLLYERRLLPSFIHADSIAGANNRQAFITLPGLGCGQFAGKFSGQLGEKLRSTLIEFLKNHGEDFPNIRAVYYDPHRECGNERHEIGDISFFVRPLTKGNEGKSQLCNPREYEESGDDFGNCELFSFVAWDHVSWPGNDFYVGSRATDDGVKAAATNSMAVMTGVEGSYSKQTNTYDPPREYRDWNDVVLKKQVQLELKNNFAVLPD